jgi:hypothetical protein
MMLHYSPQRYADPMSHEPDTAITIVDQWTVNVDAETYSFDSTDVAWPNIAADTSGVIQEAHLEGGELYLTILRRYSERTGCPWDTGEYQ